jgi:hypothetical protein
MAATAPARENLHTGDRYVLTERFELLPALNNVLDTFTASVAAAELVAALVANKSFELLGTGAVTADLTRNAGGGVNVLTHGGATDSAIILPHLSTGQSPWTGVEWKPSNQPHLVWNLKTPSSITNTTYWVGLKLTNTPVLATDDDQAFFRFTQGTDTNWQCVYSIAGTDVTVDSGVAVAASTKYRLWITVDENGIPTFWINGVARATGAALTAAAALIPYVGVLSATNAVAKSIVLRSCEGSIVQ